MAKFEIFNSTSKINQSSTPNTSALALPFSLATQQGEAINSVIKSIADIQKDMYAIEDQNKYNEALPNINLEIQKKYSKYEKSLDINAPNKLIKDLQPSNFKSFFEGQSNNVQSKLKSHIAERAALLVPKLNGVVVQNNLDKFTVGIGDAFDNAIALMVSNDLEEIAAGTATFETLKNNKAYPGYVGEKEWKELVDKKTSLKNKLLLNKDLTINPKSVKENQDKLKELVGASAAEQYVKEANAKLASRREAAERKERLIELRDQETQIGAFSELLVRIDNLQKNKSDPNAVNEMPTIEELYEMNDLGIINEAMFIKLSDFMTEEQQDGMSSDEMYLSIVSQIAAAKTIETLDNIKKSYLLDNSILKELAIEDVSSFNAIIDKAKNDFEAHRDYKFYLKTIQENIQNVSVVSGRRGKLIAQGIANQEQQITKSYTKKVMDGMRPEFAYLSVLEEDFNNENIPTLDTIAFPKRVSDWGKSLTDADFFEKASQEVLDKFKNSNKSNFDAKELINDLDEIKFAKDLFEIRLRVAPGDQTAKYVSATSTSIKLNNKDNLQYDPTEK